jgi:hypothetical protein
MTGISGSSHTWLSKNRLLLLLLSAALIAPAAAQAPSQPSTAPDALPSAPPSGSPQNAGPVDNTRITIPVGTRIPLVLTRPLDSNAVRLGDAVFAQVANPVMVDDEVAIPAGTFVRGKVEKLNRRGTQGELLMQSASLVLGSGSVVELGGPTNIESEQWTAWNNPEGRAKAGIILAPLVGSGLGMLIGNATDKTQTTTLGGGSMPSGGFGVVPGPLQPVPGLTVTTRSHTGLVVGGAVGGAVGFVTSLALIAHSHQFYLEEGSPLAMVLTNPVSLTRAQIAEAEHSATPPAPIVRRSRTWPGVGNTPPTFPGTATGNGPASCSAGQEWCMGQCQDSIAFISDDNNCGRCGNSCSIGESCTGGSCSCAAGYSSCMGSCVSSSSFISDNNNCGSCGHSCSIGESCMGGSCMKIGP